MGYAFFGALLGWYIYFAITHTHLGRRETLINHYRQFIEGNAELLRGDEKRDRTIDVVIKMQGDAFELRMLKSDLRNTSNPIRAIRLMLRIKRIKEYIY